MKIAPELIGIIIEHADYVVAANLFRLNKKLTMFINKYCKINKLNHYMYLIFRNKIKGLVIDEIDGISPTIMNKRLNHRYNTCKEHLTCNGTTEECFINDLKEIVDVRTSTEIRFLISCKHNLFKFVRMFKDIDQIFIDEALCAASFYGHTSIAKYLINNCDINVRYGDEAALRWSIAYRHFDIAKLLIKKGANPLILNNGPSYASRDGNYIITIKASVENNKCIFKFTIR